jgi:endonuclease G
MGRLDELLTAATARIEAADRTLAEELRGIRERGAPAPLEPPARFLESTTLNAAAEAAPQSLETIVLRVGRPVLAIVQDAPRLDFSDAASEVWRSRLAAAADRVSQAARAVGRIDVAGHPQLQWVGTAWLIGLDTVVTNRHVAREFGRADAGRFTFRQGPADEPIRASIDFLKEVDRRDRFEFRVVEILHIEGEDGPDLALLRIEPPSGQADWPSPIPLAVRPPAPLQQIAVIGYPARDSRIPDQRLMQSIFGDVYDTKRLAPGQVTEMRTNVLLHDCSTLGGNSGSVLLDLTSGEAVGLHFAGRFLEANFAVPAALAAERLDWVRRRHSPAARPQPGTIHDLRPAGPTPPIAPPSPPALADVGETFIEARLADYVDRTGYDRAFLGVDVPLPVVSDSGRVLLFDWNGREEHELTYEHFSVVMSRTRRLCLLSAVNINGNRPHRLKRSGWRLDPRIPADRQIKDECYGSTPRFSRGHMTRREDPIWGEADDARLGNRDSMHVTNTAPQMQPFNAGIWLGLEDYALDNAREDDMRISVFTGPFLLDDDPVRYGVQVPRSFWKVIAFIHDGTGALCATGFAMSQQDFLREEEFVFGQHQTWQTSIRTIERGSGIRFGELASLDPLGDEEEGLLTPLTDFGNIVFRRG